MRRTLPETIHTTPLSAEAFAPFGDVIEAAPRSGRTDDLAKVLVGVDGRPQVSVLRTENGAALPLKVERMERHPLGTQAFIPVNGGRFFVVVAPAGEFDPSAIRAFASNGRQGINYRPGTWHHSFLAATAGDDFVILERFGPGENCDFFYLQPPLRVTE